MSAQTLSSSQLSQVIGVFHAALAEHQGSINALNVFPVPDGDTGTNMLATLSSVEQELSLLGPTPSVTEICQAVAKGSLMGARGNSGVILCQVLRGVTDELKIHEVIDAPVLTSAFEKASEAAYKAVMRPVEGTILTIARAGAEGAAATGSKDLLEVATGARDGALSALWATPDQLPVLAEAGVVDAGGTGLELFYESFVSVLSGEAMPEHLALPAHVAELIGSTGSANVVRSSTREDLSTSVGMLSYEVMFLLEAPDERIDEFKQAWLDIGDSIVVVGGDGLWNCHIHTEEIGAAIEAGITAGTPRAIRVTDLREEVNAEESWVLEASRGHGQGLGESLMPVEQENAKTAVVAVASGDGIARILSSLGVARIVAGGQSMNPSTKELLDAVESLAAPDVVILPNNTNIIPVAHKVAEIANKHVGVIETKGVQQGLAALLEFDPGSSGDANLESMRAAAARVVSGEVTKAVRAAPSAVGSVNAGDWIGLSASGIESVATSMAQATCGLLETLIRDDHEIVTLFEGEACPRPEVEEVLAYLAKRHPHLSVERLLGGQPLYPLLVSIE